MTTITTNAGILTLVNVFTVKPENQERLVSLLVDATEQTMRHLPGFVSANIHKSIDGTRVINYAQWQSRDDFEAMRTHPTARPHMEAASALAEVDPTLCTVVHTSSARE